MTKGWCLKERVWPPHACELTLHLAPCVSAQTPSTCISCLHRPVPHPTSHGRSHLATWVRPSTQPMESNVDCGWEKSVGQDDHLTLQFILLLEWLSSGCHILM